MSQTKPLFVLVVFVLVAAIAPAPVAAAPLAEENETEIRGEFTNTVPVERSDGTVYLWESEPNTLQATFQASNTSNIYKICVQNEAGERIVCKDKSADPGSSTVNFEFDNLSAFRESKNVTVVLWNNFPGESERMGSDTVNITVIEKDGDIDGDKLSNAEELSHNTSMFLMDTDKDSLNDGEEVNNYGTSPTSADTDGDNLTDRTELSMSLSPTNPDTDGDGIPDGVEVELGLAPKDPTADTDGDGLTDAYEYEHGSDPTKVDTDGDGLNDKLEYQLGTNPTDSSTTPMLLFAGGTLFGVVAVAARWVWPSWKRQFDQYLPSLPETEQVTPNDEPAEESAAAETSVSREFDHAELQQSSQPVLTDEDKVIQLLRENDGWVYQSLLVEETEWSKSKVSRLLSKMVDEGTVEKISVGRQNIVAEEGSMPDGFGSPFDE